jgi:protocatechuate 4,5-dioxygenase beta chain/2,3-dihydroxyphenylpropionate 1,2-dioxygenase
MEAVLDLTDADIDRDAGNGGHEIRPWIVATAVWGQALEVYGYEPQPAWLTGTACAAAFEA